MGQKRKRETSSSSVDVKALKQKIKTLEAALSDKANLNNIVELLDFADSEKQTNAQVIHAAIHALHRAFTRLRLSGDLDRPKEVDTASAKATVTQWLREQYLAYQKQLRSLLSHEEPGLQLPALNILMQLVKTESEHQSKQRYHFAANLYAGVVESVITSTNFSAPLQKEFLEKYVNAYDDLRHYFYKESAIVMESARPDAKTKPRTKKRKIITTAPQELARNVFSIAEGIRSMPTEPSEINEFWYPHPSLVTNSDDDTNDLADEDALLLGGEGLEGAVEVEEDEKKDENGKSKQPLIMRLRVHQRSFQDCWIALMRLPLPEDLYKKILLILHKRILPHLLEPTMLMDFLTDSYNVGGAVSLLALNGLFILITEHNLDYPDFYHKLYSLLDRDLLHVKYRSRFFRLLEIFLASPLLPVALIAAFVKRLARLSLSAPPAASVVIIPFIYNLLRRHPTCMKLIHKNEAVGVADDPYDFDEKDPYKCNALESSLWEVQTLAEHYYANVSTLAKIFSDKFLKPRYEIEDFLDHTYSTFFKNEMERKRKKDPPVAFEKPGECEWEI